MILNSVHLFPLFMISLTAVSATQTASKPQAISVPETQSTRIALAPPINVPLRFEKSQTHHIGDKHVTLILVKNIIFKPSNNTNIIGYDISAELVDIRIEGDSKILGLLANSYPEIGSIGQYSYDNANERLTLHNVGPLWESLIRSIYKIKQNAGDRSDTQRAEDKKLFDRIENIPVSSRQAILSQDMALILSFVGKTLPNNRQNDDNMLIKSRQSIDRQNGLIQEINDYYVSNQTGLVHKLMRTNQSQGDKKRKIITTIKVSLP